MTSPRTLVLLSVALLVTCFGLAARLGPQFQGWRGSRGTGDVINVVLGDSRRLFANQFYLMADKYYHAGYYPGIFDNNAAFQTAHMAADTGEVSSKNQEGEEVEHNFLGPKRNWIDSFGRHFYPTRHTHLDHDAPDELSGSQEVREILPWLKLSSDLDPENELTYVVTAFWLRQRMNNVREADATLHEGLRNCPDSYQILFELGRLYEESYHDHERARNVWQQGVRKWLQLDPQIPQVQVTHVPIRELVGTWVERSANLVPAQQEDRIPMEQLCTYLSKLEENAGHLPQAIEWLKAAQRVSITPQTIQENINRLSYKLGLELNPLLKPLF